MKLYASMVTNGAGGWGDGFPALWFCEYLHSRNPDREIDLYAGGNAQSAATLGLKVRHAIQRRLRPVTVPTRGAGAAASTQSDSFGARAKKYRELIGKKPFHHSDHIEKPDYIASWLYAPPSPDGYDEMLVTHHLHAETSQSWASPPIRDPEFGGLMPPLKMWSPSAALPDMLRMDLNADGLNIMVKEGFAPTLPQLKPHVEAEFASLPDEYVAIQLRSRDSGPPGHPEPIRNGLCGDEYREWAAGFLLECADKWKLPLVVTSDFVPVDGLDLIDGTQLSLWAKIKALAKARYTYVVHSGFGMIAAAYRGLRDVKLMNPSREGLYRNPPALLFSNVHDPDPPEQYTVSPPGWVDQAGTWEIDFDDAMRP